MSSRRPRLLFVNQYFPPDTAATAYLLGELTEDLARDHEVHVVTGAPSYGVGSDIGQPGNTTVHRVRSTRFDRARMLGRILNYATFLTAALVACLRVPRPDLVVALTDPPLSGVIGAVTAWRHRSRFACVYMDLYPDIAVALDRVGHPLVERVWRGLNRVVRRRADRLVVVGRDMQERLAAEGIQGDKLVLIPNWAGDWHPATESRIRTRERLGWGRDFVVIHAGNVGLAQSLDPLVEAATLLRTRSSIRFVILGEGAARRSLRRRSEELGLRNVEFLARLPRDEAQPVMAAADVHLVSLARGLAGTAVPSKVYGILALGSAFVAAVEPGSEVDLVARETQAGITVRPGDARELADKLVELSEQPETVAAMGLRARAEYERSYRPQHAIARYRALISALTSNG